MSGSMRAQLSLLFNDEELYNNFILPSKNDRMLHQIIMKCLSAYYYNDEVRKLIEGVDLEAKSQIDSLHIHNQQESINNIRDLLTMQSFLSRELANEMEDGIDEMSDILDNVNKRAESYDGVKSTNNAYGGKTLYIESKNVQENKQVSEQDSTQNNSEKGVFVSYNVLDKLTSYMDKLDKLEKQGLLGNLEVASTVKENVEQVPIEEAIEKVEEIPVVEEKVVEKKIKSTTKKKKDDTSEDDLKLAPPPVIEEDKTGEAMESIGELLGSIGIDL